MYWREIATFVEAVRTVDDEGYKQVEERRRTAFVDKKSATRSEFYAAMQSGEKITLVLLVRAADYHDETRIDFQGKSYEVVRAYTKAGEIYELNCKEKSYTAIEEVAES